MTIDNYRDSIPANSKNGPNLSIYQDLRWQTYKRNTRMQ
ncbi:MAG: hypothetical protein CSYNP_03565 [Syntrophus sp. SKADARSKE-3]|nr:hypothetical protein [Syntrophus sp. SKADARSKE-3]